jgi:hypothetical protein
MHLFRAFEVSEGGHFKYRCSCVTVKQIAITFPDLDEANSQADHIEQAYRHMT